MQQEQSMWELNIECHQFLVQAVHVVYNSETTKMGQQHLL